MLEDGVAVHPGHVEVEEHDVDAGGGLQDLQGLLAVAGFEDPMAEVRENRE